jgi:hypothetical protein
MGEERRGVLREIRFVTGESRVTSDAAKPAIKGLARREGAQNTAHTNVAGQDEEVIVC